MKSLLYKVLIFSTLGILFLSATMFTVKQASTEIASLPFKDIAASYAKQQISVLYENNIVSGYAGGYYLPKQPVSRAEFAAILVKTLGLNPLYSDIPAFQDVTANDWEYPWVQAGVSLGMFSGYSNTLFGPSQSIKREEAASMIVRALEPRIVAANSLQKPLFHDVRSISAWAVPSVSRVQQLGIMNGYEGNFRPQDHLTREEIAVVLYHLHNRLKNQTARASTVNIHMGWQYLKKGEEFKQLVEKSSMLNTLSPRWFFLDQSGAMTVNIERDLLDWAKRKGYQIWPMVGNRFDRTSTSQLLSNPQSRQRFIDGLVQTVKQHKIPGINLDFENIDPKDRANFTAFVKELAASLHAASVKLSVDVPPDLGTDWSDPYDYRELGRHADYVVLMAYDEHWANGPKAGSVSSSKWMEKAVNGLISYVPAKQVIVALPLYSRDWSMVNGKNSSADISLQTQSQIVRKYGASYDWDGNVGQYVFRYWKDGGQHQIWLEDSRSLARRYQGLLNQGVGGVAFWYVGGETPDVWDSLNNVRKLHEIRSGW